VNAKWWGEGLFEQYGERLFAFDRYPEDATILLIEPLDVDSMGLSREITAGTAHDLFCVVDGWRRLDEFLEKMPNPETDPQIGRLAGHAAQIRAQDRYLIFG